MSYLNQVHDPKRRAGALAGTVAINGAVALAVITGLTMSGLRPEPEVRKPMVEFKIPPPPEPTQTPPPQPRDATAPTPPAPLPPIPLPPVSDVIRDVFDPTQEVIPDVIPRADQSPAVTPTPSPSPAPSFTPTAARPSNNAASWITTDDYPRRSLVDGNEGTARYRLVIGTSGRVSSCEVTASTGDRQLDQATCRLLTSRARFEAAKDDTGAKVIGTYTGTVRWEIPD